MSNKRTDLALEARAIYEKDSGALNGIRSEEYERDSISVTKISVETEAGAKAIGKPIGTYITAALTENWHYDSKMLLHAAHALSSELTRLLPGQGTVMVVGLGNRFITSDSVGPAAIEHIIVTRHLREAMPNDFGEMRSVCALSPGVLGITGIETAEIVKGVCRHVSPQAVIAIDALASTGIDRLCRTFQISDTGITPGAGAYNSREGLNEQTLGVPVIAIGVPTVVEGMSFAIEALERFGIPEEGALEMLGEHKLLVTPKDIDDLIVKSAKVIGYAINLALHGEMSVAEMEQMTS